MKLSLRPALEMDFEFCQSLNRLNMASYFLSRNISWDPQLYLASWSQFENFVITKNDQSIGVLRLLEVDDALEIRDLHVLPAYRGQGVGKWAVIQTKILAATRAILKLRLRVYADNPAQNLYLQQGFHPVTTTSGVMHMVCELPPN